MNESYVNEGWTYRGSTNKVQQLSEGNEID
jgi:hypothetical protein